MLAMSLGITSCDLDEYPYGFYSDENFYTSEEDATSAMYYAYNALTYQENATGMFYIGECASESTDLKSGEDGANPGSQGLDEWTTHLSTTNTVLETYFKYQYIAINRANAVIYNVEGSETLDQDACSDILGEAYYLRAHCYFNLVKNYGLVPIHTEMIQSITQTEASKAASMDEMYNQIIADLTKADELFTSYTQSAGRANKAAAQGLLGKVYLYAASSKESGVPYYTDMAASADEMYALSATWSKKVLDASENGSSPFGLASTLEEIFDCNNENCSEHLFLINFDRTGSYSGNYSNILMYFTPNNGGTAYYTYYNGSLISSYFGYEVFQTTDEFYATFDDTDKRKTDIMSEIMYGSDGSELATADFPFTLKYMDPDHSGEKTSSEPILLRFSDVALNYAEAVGNDDAGWVAKIRARAGLGALTASSTSDFRDLIIQERAWEFAFEGNRLYDLRRKGLVSEVDAKAAAQNLTAEQEAFFPIPQRELDLNTSL